MHIKMTIVVNTFSLRGKVTATQLHYSIHKWTPEVGFGHSADEQFKL